MTRARDLLLPRATTSREVSRRRVIRAVMLSPGLQQVEIAARTGLSEATVSSLVSELQGEGVLRVDESGSRGRGKHLRLDDVHGVAVGVEVDGDSVTVVTRTVDSSDYKSGTAEVGAQRSRAAWLTECGRLIKEHVRDYGLGPADVISIGLGIPARIHPRTAEITRVTSPDYDLAGQPATWFQSDFPDAPVIPDHDANFAAFGEHLYGAGRNVNMMLYVKASRTIGAGLMIDGQIFRGRHGLASELGHLRMRPWGVVCRCGNRGCLETLVAGPRLLAQVREAYDGYMTDAETQFRQPHSLQDLIQQANDGDRACLRVLRDTARTIGAAVAQACTLVNPELVVLGGDLARAAGLLVEPATEELHENALAGMFPESNPCRIVRSELKELAGALGALASGLVTERPALRSGLDPLQGEGPRSRAAG